MRLLFEAVVQGGFLVDILGVLGLGMLGLASARLAREEGSSGGILMTAGALMMLAGRLWVLLSPALMTPDVRSVVGPQVMQLLPFLPAFLMTGGLAGVVWGLWGYEKGQREAR